MSLLLQRYTIRPRHLDQWRETWPEEVALRREHGFTAHRAFLETHAEPKLTWLFSHDEPTAGADELASDPRWQRLVEARAPHVFRNEVTREVRPELLHEAGDAHGGRSDRTVVMRRYSIVGEWCDFLAVWRRIVPVREKYGFTCLFAVADEPHDLFTWAFDFDGAWADFGPAQKGYYSDPERVALRGVFDHMADYTITPAAEIDLG